MATIVRKLPFGWEEADASLNAVYTGAYCVPHWANCVEREKSDPILCPLTLPCLPIVTSQLQFIAFWPCMIKSITESHTKVAGQGGSKGTPRESWSRQQQNDLLDRADKRLGELVQRTGAQGTGGCMPDCGVRSGGGGWFPSSRLLLLPLHQHWGYPQVPHPPTLLDRARGSPRNEGKTDEWAGGQAASSVCLLGSLADSLSLHSSWVVSCAW